MLCFTLHIKADKKIQTPLAVKKDNFSVTCWHVMKKYAKNETLVKPFYVNTSSEKRPGCFFFTF